MVAKHLGGLFNQNVIIKLKKKNPQLTSEKLSLSLII